MANPDITIRLVGNQKRNPVKCDRLFSSLREVHDGAWVSYLELEQVVRDWISSITIQAALMPDGMTLIQLNVRLKLASSGATGDWEEERRFDLPQLSGKKAGFVSQLVKNSIQREMKKVAIERRDDFLHIYNSLEKASKGFAGYPIEKQA